MRLRIEKATTYQSPLGGRRYLTKAAAYSHWAKQIIFSKCVCEDGSDCVRVHDRFLAEGGYDVFGGKIEPVFDTEEYLRVKRRLAGWLRWRDERRTPEPLDVPKLEDGLGEALSAEIV